jgi:hypothetical protein
MKNFVLGALLVAAASSAACTSSSTPDVTVTGHWSFKHIADGAPRSCPTGFDTATIFAQPVDSETAAANGNLISADLFNCSDAQGTVVLPDGVYLMSVRIETHSGAQKYADSEEVLIDTATDAAFDVEILDDGGYFFFTWSLADKATNAKMTCADAALTGSNASIDAVSTLVSNMSFFKDDKYTCSDHYGTTAGLPAGTYTVSVSAETRPGNVVGAAPSLLNKVITAPNGTTDLGHVVIPID